MSALGLKSHLAYSIPALPLALLGVTVYIYLPKFYASQGGADLVILGSIVGTARLWNAIVDPSFGYLSDHTRSRLGRRLSWMAVSSLPLVICGVLLFSPSLRPSFLSVEAWFGIFSVIFFTLLSAYQVPYETLGTELTDDYHDRTKLAGFRTGFFLFGTLCTAMFPLAIEPFGIPEAPRWQALCVGYGILLLAVSWVAVSALSKLPAIHAISAESEPDCTLRQNFRELAGNRPFLILLGAFMLSSFASAMPAALILFFIEDVIISSKSDAFLGLYFFLGIVMLPLWLSLSRRIGKRGAFIGSMLVNTVAFIGVYFVGMHDELLYAIFVALSALGLGGTLALPPSMQADVIEWERIRTGRLKGGQMMGLWSVAREASTALGTGTALTLLGLSGFDATSPIHTESELYALRILYSVVPCIINLFAIILANRFELDLERERKT